jgi:hypothetical protein
MFGLSKSVPPHAAIRPSQWIREVRISLFGHCLFDEIRHFTISDFRKPATDHLWPITSNSALRG